ncbi:MAG: hypothetical protein KUG77_21980 [Nannocystaceae bacterium]|nr:hypothetical protein [Nannocystaceae bacterium]
MQRLPLRLSLAMVLAPVAGGCGEDGGVIGGDTETNSTGAGTGVTMEMSGSSSSSSDPTTPTSTSTTDPSTSAADSSTTGGAPSEESSGGVTAESSSGACQVWEVTYDLVGSEFEISGTPAGAGDQVNVLQEPYDAGGNIGPGSFVLRFEDIEGVPGGLATMVTYEMALHFVVGGTVTVTTDIQGQAGPEECGITQGLLNDGTVAWAPPQIVEYVTTGEVLCEGLLCSLGGLPNGTPVDMGTTTDQPLTDFVFADDLGAFTMAELVVDMDGNSTTSWAYTGTETGRELIDAPDCLCR